MNGNQDLSSDNSGWGKSPSPPPHFQYTLCLMFDRVRWQPCCHLFKS
nr:MAG TPA: hypothetical protein [Caudoviricetes sp.]